MSEQVTRVVIEQEDKVINREIAEKNEQIKEQQIRQCREQAERLAELNKR